MLNGKRKNSHCNSEKLLFTSFHGTVRDNSFYALIGTPHLLCKSKLFLNSTTCLFVLYEQGGVETMARCVFFVLAGKLQPVRSSCHEPLSSGMLFLHSQQKHHGRHSFRIARALSFNNTNKYMLSDESSWLVRISCFAMT